MITRHNNSGFTLVEVLIGVALVGVLSVGVISFQAQQVFLNSRQKMAADLSAQKSRMLATITSDSAWLKTVELSAADSNFSCIGSDTGCVAVTDPAHFSLYEADGSLVFASSPTSGYNSDGTVCTTPPCAVHLEVKWKPACSPADVNCKYPLIQISGSYSSGSSASLLSFAKYNFSINRPSTHASYCPSAAPACPGQLVACTFNGWQCLPPKPPNCQGTVTWVDSTTTFGTCSAIIPVTLHDTDAVPLNTGPDNTGTATFHCIPGQPNNGLIFQSGTCALNPLSVNGACGTSNGQTLPLPPALNLCATGTPSTVGTFAWTCMGSNGGTTAVCSATPTVVNPICTPDALPSPDWSIGLGITAGTACSDAIAITANQTIPSDQCCSKIAHAAWAPFETYGFAGCPFKCGLGASTCVSDGNFGAGSFPCTPTTPAGYHNVPDPTGVCCSGKKSYICNGTSTYNVNYFCGSH